MRVGDYEVIEELGRGGVGVVYRARGPDGRDVAVKVLLQVEPARERRFEREVQALEALRHPGIVPLIGAGRHQGRPFLVTELVQGESLQARLDRAGPLGARASAALGRDLARALAHAHAHGVLHRDVKPANVLLASDGAARLIDFGLAREVDHSSLTRSGQMLGTPGYWSPEQARGERALGPPTDAYGLGATLFAAVTGQAPFVAESWAELLVLTQSRVPAPASTVRPGVEPLLDRLCARCLAKDPADRPTLSEVEGALEALLARPRARRARPRAKAAISIVGVTLALLVAVATLAARREVPGADDGVAAATSSAPPGVPSAPLVAVWRAPDERAMDLLRRAVPLATARAGQLAEATRLASEATGAEPASGRAWHVRAWITHRAALAATAPQEAGRQLDEAARQLDEAQRAGYPDDQVQRLRAQLQQAQGFLLTLLEERDRPDPDANQLLDLARAYARLGRHDEALEVFRRLEAAAPGQWVVAYHMGTELAVQGDLDAGAERFEAAIERATRLRAPSATLRMLRISLADARAEQGQHAQAEAQVEAVLATVDAPPGEQGLARAVRARGLLEARRYDEALEEVGRSLAALDVAIKADGGRMRDAFWPRRVVPLAIRGSALASLGRAEPARAALREALAAAAVLPLEEHPSKRYAFEAARAHFPDDDQLARGAHEAFP